jgi:hypothetical protein
MKFELLRKEGGDVVEDLAHVLRWALVGRMKPLPLFNRLDRSLYSWHGRWRGKIVQMASFARTTNGHTCSLLEAEPHLHLTADCLTIPSLEGTYNFRARYHEVV